MATLTIRDLDDALKQRLRVRAASRNRSMEEEARQILRAALAAEPAPAAGGVATRIRARFAGIGGVELPVPVRDAVRPPPDLTGSDSEPSRQSAGPPGSVRRRRR